MSEDENIDQNQDATLTNTQPPASEPVTQPESQEPRTEEKRDAYHRRQENKRWRERLQEIEDTPVEITDDVTNMVMGLAEKEGFKLDDPSVKSQAQFMGKAMAEVVKSYGAKTRATISDQKRKVLRDTSTANLSETLQSLGYVKGTARYQEAGNVVWRKMGISNPDVFSDSSRVKEVITSHLEALSDSNGGGVDDAIRRRAAAPIPSREPRTGAPSSDAAKRAANFFGVSENAAKDLLEKNKNMPKFARRKY
jgi:hypothetical protein